MFDAVESFGQSTMMSGQTGKSAQELVNAEMQADLMGIEKSNDPIENFGKNCMLSHMTNMSANELTDIDIRKNLMFDK